jgi:hypothetical protein
VELLLEKNGCLFVVGCEKKKLCNALKIFSFSFQVMPMTRMLSYSLFSYLFNNHFKEEETLPDAN